MTAFPKAVAEGWHPIATTAELKTKPLARQLLGQPIVAFRAAKGPSVLLDRCPHRNFPLSDGRVRGGEIECPYHGWRFDGSGRCSVIPGSDEPTRSRAEALPTIERFGAIWTSLAREPAVFPALPHPIGASGFDQFWWPVRPSHARLIDAIENLLDPAHPHFLHAGIVRSGKVRRPVEVTVRVSSDRAEAVYVENARPSALISRLIEGIRTTSTGRFFAPTIAQIAFEGPKGPQLAITVFFTPETEDRVRPFAHFATPTGRAPARLKEIVLRALNAPVLWQDRAALRAQAINIERFGAPKYALGPLDFLLPAIRTLAEGQAPEPSERKVVVHL